ncbi:glycosyltransferase [Mucilaginibacter sp. RS28]|uniref:Glycosyltransferase n=1 Tax=Mucilaginibacter straminoryzae TaxID=2932774 RepID=A0A9X2BAJ2_9SPHI|nr:glycosyltransferase [Mucilaginibacter straminoryzae]MCJ8208847.1 glycosyltransferase [Mucilaginibacter straminoryzae]
MRVPHKIKQPTRGQYVVLRLMIVIGLCSVFFLLRSLFAREAMGERHLYILLMAAFTFTSFKVLYEWYHYWSITVPEAPTKQREWTVDILTTFCEGEPYEMIVETLSAIQQITHPHETYLCDEADDPYLREVCRQLGVHHITREIKIDAKAGNINNALRFCKGELCVVLDPDHVPNPDFLDHVVDHFNDENVGYVQVVQAYKNHDISWVAKGAAQQTYQFYGPMMMTMHAYGTAQAIGANCTFRRSALDSIGGHAAGLAEDMHTSMQLHAKGWKSVYVPVVVTEGLVPATLSAYYKQQLKWSRGVFELLVTSYIKLFTKFNWRQKLHYGLLPLFYLSGFVFLINFIVPIISLTIGAYPLKVDFSAFALVSLPFVTSVIAIRHYVQRWVMEENEQGFHIIGGFLLIVTWWVFIVGFIYTIIRKKVPYIPTPKDIADEKNLLINIPNISIFILSAAAIAFSLYTDLNPYNLIMAGMAAINCCFMVFSVMISQQFAFRTYKQTKPIITAIAKRVKALKVSFWFFRRRLYSGARSVAFMFVILAVCASLFEFKYKSRDSNKERPIKRERVFLSGIFYPAAQGGITSINNVQTLQTAQHVHFGLISAYIPWGDSSSCFPSKTMLDSIYANHSVPMITWEPWQKLFKHGGIAVKDTLVFSHILKGQFDKYIDRFALHLKATRQPVFLRFAHEADNPFYPWSQRGGNTPAQFKAAWKYVHQRFDKLGVYNVAWVWNPWKPQNVEKYFPGDDYVDWIGVTGLNFGSHNPGGKSYGFAQLYTPYHRLALTRRNIPVMIAEFGALNQDSLQRQWLQQARKDIATQFGEVQGLVLFNTAFDHNIPDGSTGVLNWTVADAGVLKSVFKNSTKIDGERALTNASPAANSNAYFSKTLDSIRGVIYAKQRYWYKNPAPLTKKVIRTDFTMIKNVGANTIKIFGPNHYYDRSTTEVAKNTHLNILYCFWLPDAANFTRDSTILNAFAKVVISNIRSKRTDPAIKSWNLGNTPLQQLKALYLQPQLFAAQEKYIRWLAGLVAAIKKEDPSRPLTMDLIADPSLLPLSARLHESIPQIDGFGLRVNNLIDTTMIHDICVPYFFSYIRPKQYKKVTGLKKGAVVEEWQDQQTDNNIDFDGLNDMWGRQKPELALLSKLWNGHELPNNLPQVKILRPAATTLPGALLTYHALVYQNNEWQLANPRTSALTFEWRLLELDQYGHVTSMTSVGNGASIKLSIPENAGQYRLLLTGVKGAQATLAISTLNLPL